MKVNKNKKERKKEKYALDRHTHIYPQTSFGYQKSTQNSLSDKQARAPISQLWSVPHYREVQPSRQTGWRRVGKGCNRQGFERVRLKIPAECKQCTPSAAVPHGGSGLLHTFTQLTSVSHHRIHPSGLTELCLFIEHSWITFCSLRIHTHTQTLIA